MFEQAKQAMGEVMKEAAFSLAETKFSAGDFSPVVLQNVSKAQLKVRSKQENVAGVKLPAFEYYEVIIPGLLPCTDLKLCKCAAHNRLARLTSLVMPPGCHLQLFVLVLYIFRMWRFSS